MISYGSGSAGLHGGWNAREVNISGAPGSLIPSFF